MHGHGHGRPACQGSGQPPMGGFDIQRARPAGDTSVDPLLDSSRQDLEGGLGFELRPPTRHTLKRIPRGARQKAAQGLDRCIRAVVSTPLDLDAWRNLLQFADCLSQPIRGGKRNNLTTQVVSQIDNIGARTSFTQSDSQEFQEQRRGQGVRQGDAGIAHRASMKLQDGDIRGAIRCLSSDENLVRPSQSVHQSLLLKHPPCPTDTRPPPMTTVPPMMVDADDVMRAIRSFAPGSAGGRDGLRPQHIKDMTDGRTGGAGALCASLADFANLVLAGGVPAAVRPVFFGASLLAFSKKDGGIRPIAVGLTLRRLVSKMAATRALAGCIAILAPRQLGVGTKGGGEALAHASRTYVASMGSGRAFVKLDFSNAFNSIRRDAIFEAVARHAPDILKFVLSAYGTPSELWFGEHTIPSAEGVQQGDPLGPLLFSLALNEILQDTKCEFISGYLDDVGLGDLVPDLIGEIRGLASRAELIGLHLNQAKCEIIGLSEESRSVWTFARLNFIEREVGEASLLGTPLHADGVDSAISDRCDQLRKVAGRLALMTAHEAMFLLRSSFALPRLQYLLRTAPCFMSGKVEQFDELVRSTLETVTNVKLDSRAWSQASLPVRWGGLGVRSAVDLSPSAFLSSRMAANALVQLLLPASMRGLEDPMFEMACSCWDSRGGKEQPVGQERESQRAWDEAVCRSRATTLGMGVDRIQRARFLGSTATGSGSWLHALPLSNLGLRLGKDELRIAVGLRIGAPLVREHLCVCGSMVERDGHHGLACRRSAGRHRRHSMANDVILRSIRACEVRAELEPTRLLRRDGKRPDGATLDPWTRGQSLVWDFTCPDTLAPSHLNQSAIAAGSAAEGAEAIKMTKYRELADAPEYSFVPIAIETLGAWGVAAQDFARELGGRLTAITGDPRETSWFKQRMDIAVQRGNAAAVLGTVPSA